MTGRSGRSSAALFGEFQAVGAGHVVVRDDAVKGFVLVPSRRIASSGARHERNDVPQALEHAGRCLQLVLVVLHEQQPALSSAHGAHMVAHAGEDSGADGEVDVHAGVGPGDALEQHRALVTPDDPVHHGQAEAGAFALLLGGEEGVEDLVLDLRGDTRPRCPRCSAADRGRG